AAGRVTPRPWPVAEKIRPRNQRRRSLEGAPPFLLSPPHSGLSPHGHPFPVPMPFPSLRIASTARLPSRSGRRPLLRLPGEQHRRQLGPVLRRQAEQRRGQRVEGVHVLGFPFAGASTGASGIDRRRKF